VAATALALRSPTELSLQPTESTENFAEDASGLDFDGAADEPGEPAGDLIELEDVEAEPDSDGDFDADH
jgi:hypothetical protein